MDISSSAAKVFLPVGQCIYCGASGAEILTKEHVFPAGMGGGLILPRASCTTCQKEIQVFETICMRKTLLPYRRSMGLIRHSNDLPATVPLLLDFELQGPTSVAFDEHPDFVVLPGLRFLPGILEGRPPTSKLEFEYKIFGGVSILDETKRRLQSQQKVGVNLDGYAWLRMLAKIAHGYTVAELGLSAFSPVLPDLILGRNPLLASHLVGMCLVSWPIPNAPPLFMINMLRVSANGQQHVAVNMRLFADLGPETPVYTVIAGTFTD